ncbi:MAG: hypothetical protein ACYCS8_05050 [Acidithiobacillus sp.]
MPDSKIVASGKIAVAVRATLMGVTALIATGCAMQPTSANEGSGGATTGRYQFGYVLSSPSDIQAQVFSGESHTYVSLPSGIQLQAATGSSGLQSPARKGPYWVVNGLSTQWSFATTRGVVNATATGAARQMALVSGAQAAIAKTMPLVAQTPAAPAATKNVTAKTVLSQAAGVKNPHASITVAHKKHTASVSDQWPHPAHPSRHLSEVFFIPGAEGRIMPLQQALVHIIPAGWQTHISPYIAPSIPVTWHRGLWTTSLNRMAKSDAWVEHVNFVKRTIRIDPTPGLLEGIPGLPPQKTRAHPSAMASVKHPVVAATRSGPSAGEKARATLKKTEHPAPFHSVATTPAFAASAAILNIPAMAPGPVAQSTIPFTPPPPIKPVVIFTTHHGDMLSHDLREYLKKKGLHLAWNLSRDWRIAYGYDLTGNLADVMNRLMHLYPIDIVGDGANRTIVVSPVR